MNSLSPERKRSSLATYDLFADVRILAGKTQDSIIIDEEPIRMERRKKWQNEVIKIYLDDLRFDRQGFNKQDAVDTTEAVDQLLKRGVFQDNIKRPFGILSYAERVKLQKINRGKNRFSTVTQVLQGIQNLSVMVADFSRRYLPRRSDSRKANRYDGSPLEYKMERLDPPE